MKKTISISIFCIISVSLILFYKTTERKKDEVQTHQYIKSNIIQQLSGSTSRQFSWETKHAHISFSGKNIIKNLEKNILDHSISFSFSDYQNNEHISIVCSGKTSHQKQKSDKINLYYTMQQCSSPHIISDQFLTKILTTSPTPQRKKHTREKNNITIVGQQKKFSITKKNGLDTQPQLTIQGSFETSGKINGKIIITSIPGDTFRFDQPLIIDRTLHSL